MKLDRRFLVLHPATARWFVQREKCAACSKLVVPTGSQAANAMRCGAAPMFNEGKRGARFEYCIDARGRRGACGAKAKLFEPKK